MPSTFSSPPTRQRRLATVHLGNISSTGKSSYGRWSVASPGAGQLEEDSSAGDARVGTHIPALNSLSNRKHEEKKHCCTGRNRMPPAGGLSPVVAFRALHHTCYASQATRRSPVASVSKSPRSSNSACCESFGNDKIESSCTKEYA